MAIPKSESGEMPFLDHLEELRWRIIYALGAAIVCVGIGFWVALQFDVVGLLAAPILPHIPEHKLVYTHPSEGFTVILNAAMTIGTVLAAPVILYQVWAFLAPAFHKHERRVAVGVLFSGLLLFIGGAALAYFVVIPLAIPWLMGFAGPSLVPLITAEDYFSFVFSMVLTFGVSFELPIVVLALAALGIVTPQFLSKYRRHAVVLIVIVGAFLTPGDMIYTTVALAVPLYFLYELSVGASFVIYRRKQRKLARLEAEAAAESRVRSNGVRLLTGAAFAVVLAASGSAVQAQVIPRLPTRPGAVPAPGAPRDTTKDSTKVKWPTPDSATQALLSKSGYSITKYQADTAYFDQQKRNLNLLASKTRRAIVQRDSQTVVSDSGIFYAEATHHVTTYGHYILSNPGSGQGDITGGPGQVDYNLEDRFLRISNARLPLAQGGQNWITTVDHAAVSADSTNGKSGTIYGGRGTLTSCEDSIPDYYFAFNSFKRTSDNTIVAGPSVLYLKDVPVFWVPFLFADNHPGRHSGIIPPQFGLGDVVRNSPSYRRNVDHVGYYWALSDYAGMSTWLDWRSSAGSTVGDPGWLKLNGEWDYKWLDRFMGGRIGLGQTWQRDGQTNTAISWNHTEDFSHDTHLNTNVNYVTSTTLQRQNTFNPYAALATIQSQATYQEKLGPASLSIGATRKQYPGREQVDQTFPTLSLTSTTIGLGKWLTWTPSFSMNRSGTSAIDQPGLGKYIYRTDPTTGVRDSVVSNDRNSEQTSITFDTPIQIFGKDFKNSFRINQQRNNFPQAIQISDFQTGVVKETRIYAATYNTTIDWNPDFSLPPFAQNRFNLTPSVSLSNVDPGPYWVASEQTNGKYVHQSKRFTTGLSASPTLFALLPGFGPFSRIRHTFAPTLSFGYAPPSTVSDEYLKALGRTRAGYLGNLAQESMSLGLNQNFEAKVRSKTDTTGSDKGQTIKLLSINVTPLTFDFERARGRAKIHGLTTDSWGYTLASDLLPGFDFSSNYSLFEGSTQTDTARFKPYLTSVSATFSIGRDQNPLGALAKLFGAPPEPPKPLSATANDTSNARQRADALQQNASAAAPPVAGSARNLDRFLVPSTQGWHAQLSFSRSSPRPPTGTNVIDFDPRARCSAISGTNTLLFDACVAQLQVQPTTDTPVGTTTVGGPVYRIPATTSVNSNVNFNLTPKWTAAWQTTYDVERHEFASHIVSLQRDIHDWRAIFGFTQSPNGNFAFNFTIALKAQQDIKFDYNRTSVRNGATF